MNSRPVARLLGACLVAGVVWVPSSVQAGDDSFDIRRFEIVGNTLLPEAVLESSVAPYAGNGKGYGDVQKALEALEGRYRQAGYSTVQVYVPEQELAQGVVRLQVTEGVIGAITVTGNQHFSTQNIRATLPALQEGKAPNARVLSENIQLANENPAKQVEVTLGVSEQEGKVDAKVKVADEDPQRVFATLDNTGTGATGKYRLGIAYQNANLFDRDHALTLAYQTAPSKPEGVKVDVFSIGYRIPLYSVGDSIDFIFGKSSVNTPTSTPVLGGALGITGKGDVLGVRYNHIFARQGEYASRLVAGLDRKYMDTRCSINGAPVAITPPTPPIASCVPYTVRPLSLTYSGQWQRPAQVLDFTIGIAHNLPLGSRYLNVDGRTDRYSYLTPGNRATPDDFTILRLGASWTQVWDERWQTRLAASGQYAATPLVAAEQFGLAGSSAVRGFNERAVAMDTGYVVNAELYGPDLASAIGLPGNLRPLAFYDFARGYNHDTVRPLAISTPMQKVGIAAIGAGLRYNLRKDISLRLDLAQVVDAGPVDVPGAGTLNTESRGDWRGHMALTVGF